MDKNMNLEKQNKKIPSIFITINKLEEIEEFNEISLSFSYYSDKIFIIITQHNKIGSLVLIIKNKKKLYRNY